MKKLLLFAVAALIAGSVSAQSIVKRSESKGKLSTTIKSPMNEVQKQQQVAPPVMLSPSKLKVGKLNSEIVDKRLPENLRNQMNQKVTSASKIKAASTTRRAPSFPEYYTGTCFDSDQNYWQWQATPIDITDSNGDPGVGFSNIMPNIWEDYGISDRIVAYEEDGKGNITIPAQPLVSTSSYTVWICDTYEEDGSLHFYVDENGDMTFQGYYRITYGAFSKEMTDFSWDYYMGWYERFTDMNYFQVGASVAPVPQYDTHDAVFYTGLADNGYSFKYQHVLLPANSELAFKNYTTYPSDSWFWSQNLISYNSEIEDFEKGKTIATADTRDFTLFTSPGEMYSPVELIGSMDGLTSNPFIGTDEGALLYAGAYGGSWSFSDGRTPILSRANLKYDLGGLETASAESPYRGLIFYQGVPKAPLYFEGVSLMLYNFSATENFTLRCKIQKATRSNSGIYELGDVVAESDVNPVVEPSDWYNTAIVHFDNFVVTDELGLDIPLDHIFIDEEFVIVIDGWNNGTFTGMALCDDGPSVGLSSTQVIRADEEEYSGYGFQSFYGHGFVGLDNAAYGYLVTDDNTNISIPAEGGTAKINIGPMLIGYDENDNPATALWLEDNSDEVPDWLTVQYTNPVQEGVDEDGDPIYDTSFDLIFTAEALPADVTSRSCHLIFYQPGAQLEVNVSQEGTSGITTTVKKTLTNGPVYNLNGQRVNANYKGIVVKDGAKVIKK